MKRVKGLGGVKGQAIGKSVILENVSYTVQCKQIDDAEKEIEKLENARDQYRQELDELHKKTKDEIDDEAAEIFLAYKEMVNDDFFFSSPADRVKNENINIEYALEEEMKTVVGIFMDMEDTYMKERGSDIETVCNTLIRIMLGIRCCLDPVKKIDEDFILIAEELAPEDMIRLDKKHLRGLVMERGGRTSHTVILAQMLEIPTVVGATGILKQVSLGDLLYLDGELGNVIINPEQNVLD